VKNALARSLAVVLAMAGISVWAADNSDRFASALYAELAGGESGNLFVSPYSIRAALAMVASGAAGATEKQLVETLGLPADRAARAQAVRASRKRLDEARARSGVTLDIANRVWSQKSFPLLPAFTSGLEDTFGAGMVEADFAAAPDKVRREINGWVEQQTRDRIRDLLPPGLLTRDARMVLVNAIYFYGLWSSPFPAAATKDEPFHLADGGQATVPLMFQRLKRAAYAELGDVQVCEIPYRGDELVMTVILPKAGGLPALEARIKAEGLAPFLAALRREEVNVRLPRFKLESQFSLAETLAKLGIRDAFNAGAADFSGMTGGRDLYVSAVVHKAFVDVNEKGTEAAAATAVVMERTSIAVPREPRDFRADRPFIFALRDRTSGEILFLGRLARP